MLNRGQIAKSGSVAPGRDPMVRIRRTGPRKRQFQASRRLTSAPTGSCGRTSAAVDEAYNAVAACRYPRLKDKPLYEPQGIRGDGPGTAVALLGRVAAGILRPRRRLAAQPKGEIFCES